MPAAPIFADGAGQVGIVEVFGQLQPKEAADANGHIAVAGKVKIQLHHVGQVPQHQRRSGQGGSGHRGHAGIDQGQLVSDQSFLRKTQHQPFDAVAEAIQADLPFCRLGVEIRQLLVISHNGARGAVPEKREEYKKAERAARGLHLAVCHIRQIADGGKDVKADAQRQRRGKHRQKVRHQRVDTARRKARVLEQRQHRQMHRNQQDQQRLFAGQLFEQQAAKPGKRRQRQQHSRAFQPCPCKKQQAECTQRPIAQGLGQQPVHRQRERKEDK